MVGTTLAAWGASAFNQWIEVRYDARMWRTRRRPLPTRRVRAVAALRFALLVSFAGPVLLAVFVNWAAASLALASLLIYVLVYTPLKVRTPLNTLVGAVVGALPPLVGWVAASGRLGTGAWILGGILLVWQIPHALALAWMYREDFRRSRFRMLPIVDPAGHLTALVILTHAFVLVPLTLTLTLAGVTGRVYAVGALLLGVGLALGSLILAKRRSPAAARGLFFATVIYLPLLLGLMIADRC
jgi:heme o synthase